MEGYRRNALSSEPPFITLRMNTERPVTLSENGGVGVLAGNNLELIRNAFYLALEKPRNPVRPELWDGPCGGEVPEGDSGV